MLLVGGNFNLLDGRKSKIIEEIGEELKLKDKNVVIHNGGNYNELKEIIQDVKNHDIVFWMANVSNDLEKIRDVKSINPKTMLITSKRNNNEYTKQEIIGKALKNKPNLIIEFNKTSKPFKMRVFDVLGNDFYDGYDVKKMCQMVMKRINFLKKMTRIPTFKSEEEVSNIFVEDEFLNRIKNIANRFHELINPMEKCRFFGNASKRFRCERGFPSQRISENRILVSRRNVCKETIQREEFVEVYKKDNKLYYKGEHKPSVDTPIQYELYNLLPEVNFMIHSHVYVDGAPFTENLIPCGALEEVEEIMKVVKQNNFKSNFAINLIGHGCTVFAKDIEFFDKVKFVEREY